MKKVLDIRPANDRLQRRAVDFLKTLGFATDPSRVIPAGTPDARAAYRVVQEREADLLLVSFHLHRDLEDRVVDGFGVLQALDDTYFRRRIPIVMPLSAFALASSFERRMEELRQRRSPAVELLVPLPENEIGAPGARFRILQLSRRSRGADSGVVSLRPSLPADSTGTASD